MIRAAWQLLGRGTYILVCLYIMAAVFGALYLCGRWIGGDVEGAINWTLRCVGL